MEFLKAPSGIEIIYEDENIIVVNKPAGLAAHSGNDRESDTLVNRIKHYLYLRGSYAPESEASFAPALCSRLDKNTCGLVTAAKNAAALREMNAGIRDGFVTKIYHCADPLVINRLTTQQSRMKKIISGIPVNPAA